MLYYANAGFESVVFGLEHSRSKVEYFWGYFVFLNAFWVVVHFGRFSFLWVIGGVGLGWCWVGADFSLGLRLLWESIVDWRC